MSGANRKTKVSRYLVTFKREVEYRAEVEVEARSAEEAVGLATTLVNDPWSTHWVEAGLRTQEGKAKVIR